MNKKILLELVQVTMGKRVTLSRDLSPEEWASLKDLADQQGLMGFLQEGLERLPQEQRPPRKPVMLQWIGEVLQGYEYRFEAYCRAIAEMASFYNEHGFKMMVLKGFSCSLNWPKPSHRPSGDIDIWVFGRQKEADAILIKEKGLQVDDSHEHHTVFYWRDFMVENHYDFINVHHRTSSPKLEAFFKELGANDSYTTTLHGEKVYLPSPNLHALFLLRHAMQHFVGAELNLRQLLDWAFFVDKHGKEVDWKWLKGVLDEFGMTSAFNIFNAICVEDLGFDFSDLEELRFENVDKKLKERVLNDILLPEFNEKKPQGFLPRVAFKFRRWKANGWKNKLCYKESLWSAFWSSAWGHLLKPKSI